MKRIIFVFVALFTSVLAFAQEPLTFKPMLANTAGEFITKESILAEPILGASPTPSTVTGFTIIVIPKTGDSFGPVTTKGNKLDEKTFQYMKSLQSGSKIVLENVTITSGKEYKGKNVTYLVK